ncbi:hypothetical protein D3C80_1923700 [compost metagenome]
MGQDAIAAGIVGNTGYGKILFMNQNSLAAVGIDKNNPQMFGFINLELIFKCRGDAITIVRARAVHFAGYRHCFSRLWDLANHRRKKVISLIWWSATP